MKRHLEREIEAIKEELLRICNLVECSVLEAVAAVRGRDSVLAEKVIAGDFVLDQAEIQLEENCLKILALYQPVANDLRFIISTIKINKDLERIGDLAVNIAGHEKNLHDEPGRDNLPFDLDCMTQKTVAMLNKSIKALVEIDAEMACEVLAADKEVDIINRSMWERTTQALNSQASHLKTCFYFLFVARALERIADLSTNIAEDVIYMKEGHIVRHGGVNLDSK